MSNLFDVLDNTYKPSSAYSFEFFERDPLSGQVGTKITELFFLLPPEDYSMNEGYKITVNRTINGAWVDDFGNDFKNIKISGSLYSYYIGTPATSSLGAQSLPPLVRSLKSKSQGLSQEYKKLAGSFASQIGLDIPGLEIISGLDEFFKLRYILSRFRDTKTKKNLTSDQAIVKKFPELNGLLKKVNEQKKLSKDIAVVYHDYDDNNHYEVIFQDFTMSRSAKDPFTINYNIQLLGIKEFANQYSGIGFSKKKENPFLLINDITNSITTTNEELLTISNVPAAVLAAISSISSTSTQVVTATKVIIKNLGINADNEITNMAQQGELLETESITFIRTVTENSFLDKGSESIDSIVSKYENEDDGYLIEDENLLRTIALGNKLKSEGTILKSIEKYFSDYISELAYDEDRTLNQNDFDVTISDDERQENSLTAKDKYYYMVIQGDTLQTLANTFYGNYEQYKVIAEVNSVTNKDFEDDGMVGKNIIIPSLFDTGSKETNYNLTYYKKTYLATPKERQIQILGTDFDLTSNRSFIINGNGDFALVYGEDCYQENMIDRVMYPIRSLNPIHPNWGIQLEIGNVPSSIIISKLYDSIEQQISLDPRTEYVYIDRETSSIESDSVRINLFYKPINGTDRNINIADVVAGLLI